MERYVHFSELRNIMLYFVEKMSFVESMVFNLMERYVHIFPSADFLL